MGRYVSPGRKSPVENRYLLPASGVYPIVLGDDLVLVGGASAAAPAWAGAIAQLNQVLDRRVGFLARVLPPRPGAAKRSLQRSQTGRVSSGFAFDCVPTMRYAATSAWQLLSVLAFNLMVVFSSRPRPVARPASGAVAFRSRPSTRCPTSVWHRADPFGLFPQLWALTKRVQTVSRESVNGPTEPSRSRSQPRLRASTH